MHHIIVRSFEPVVRVIEGFSGRFFVKSKAKSGLETDLGLNAELRKLRLAYVEKQKKIECREFTKSKVEFEKRISQIMWSLKADLRRAAISGKDYLVIMKQVFPNSRGQSQIFCPFTVPILNKSNQLLPESWEPYNQLGKQIIANEKLLELWEKLEASNLNPYFSYGDHGKINLEVKLPN